jgi:hypothetical protein
LLSILPSQVPQISIFGVPAQSEPANCSFVRPIKVSRPDSDPDLDVEADVTKTL